MTCYNSELPIGPPGPTGPQGQQGPPGESAALPYKVYTALLTQSGEDAPTAIELENTLGATISYARDGSGSYNCFASSEIFTDKTVVIMPNSVSSSVYPRGLITVYTNLFENLNIFYFSTYDIVSETDSDDILLRTPIEIRVYN